MPTARTPELTRSTLSFSDISDPDLTGFGVYKAEDLGIDPDSIHAAARELRAPGARLWQAAEDDSLSFEHTAFRANLRRASAVFHDYPALNYLLKQLTSFVQTSMARDLDRDPPVRHRELIDWQPSSVQLDRYRLANDAEGGRHAAHSFVPGRFTRASDRSKLLTARITLDGEQQLEVLPYRGTIPRAVHLAAGKLLLSREAGLFMEDTANGSMRGPMVRMRTPTNQLSLTVTDQY